MKPSAPINLSDLLDAFEWVSATATLENVAYVSRSTGKTYITAREMDVGDELPDDIDDGREYIAVPHKNELNLGRHLAISFAEDELPESADAVHAFFRRVALTVDLKTCWSAKAAWRLGTNMRCKRSKMRCANGAVKMTSP